MDEPGVMESGQQLPAAPKCAQRLCPNARDRLQTCCGAFHVAARNGLRLAVQGQRTKPQLYQRDVQAFDQQLGDPGSQYPKACFGGAVLLGNSSTMLSFHNSCLPGLRKHVKAQACSWWNAVTTGRNVARDPDRALASIHKQDQVNNLACPWCLAALGFVAVAASARWTGVLEKGEVEWSPALMPPWFLFSCEW
jgi:hypothetical protein